MPIRSTLSNCARPPCRLALLTACTALVVAGCASTGPVATDARPVAVAGLQQPAEILIDRWGVPHIYAGTLYDAFVAQGWTGEGVNFCAPVN